MIGSRCQAYGCERASATASWTKKHAVNFSARPMWHGPCVNSIECLSYVFPSLPDSHSLSDPMPVSPFVIFVIATLSISPLLPRPRFVPYTCHLSLACSLHKLHKNIDQMFCDLRRAQHVIQSVKKHSHVF